MKTANERAREIAALTYGVPSASYGHIERVLKEYARDQRHACAEAVAGIEAVAGYPVVLALSDAHTACFNTPFPGEGQ